MDSKKIIISFVFLLLTFFIYAPVLQAQKSVIDKKVDENNKAKKEAALKAKEDEAKKNNLSEEKTVSETGIEESGRAILIPDPATEDVNSYFIGTANASSEDKVKLPDAQRVIDTVSFQKRIVSVKKREQLVYGRGLLSKVPILHTNKYDKAHSLDPNFKVFGWHPFWMTDAYKSYNFSLLSAVAYFSYEVNPKTGSYKTIHDWETTELIDLAHKSKCKVLLSASNFGKEDNELFLNNRAAQRTFVNTIIELIKKRKADGVHIDFEEIPKSVKDKFTDFMLDLTAQIKGAIPNAWVTLTLPAIDFDRVYDMQQLGNQIDLFIISGYEFYGSNTKFAGPIAPAKGGGAWWQLGLEGCIDDYLATGIKPNKLILSVPYYGGEWVTNGLKAPAESKKFIAYPMYRDIRRINRTPVEEPLSMSMFIPFRDSQDNNRQIWFDDSLSLAKKYDFIIAKKIGGAGIWALGYDNGYVELWQALAGKFALKPKASSQKASLSYFMRVMNTISRVAANPTILLRNPTSAISIFGGLFGASALGFLVLWRYGCRFKRVFNLALKGGITVLLLIALALIIVIATKFNSWYMTAALFLVGGFIIGAIAFLFISRSFLTESELP